MAEMGLAEGIDLLGQRAKLLKILLIAGFVTIAAVLIGQVAELQGLISLEEGAELSSGAAIYAAVALADGLLTIVTIVFFSMWIYRAAANIFAAGTTGFDSTAGWAVGWFFIPFANLVKPFQAMRQIWNASHGESAPNLDNGNNLLTIWWTTWLLSSIQLQ